MKTLIFLLFLPILGLAQNEEESIVYDFAEVDPEFPGGRGALQEFLINYIEYPDKARQNGEQGYVYVTFVVQKNGELEDIKVRKGVSELLDAEAIRVVSLMPNWTPATQNGEPVSVHYTLPINFRLG